MTALLLAVLAANPTDVFAFHDTGPGAERALKQEVKDTTLVDATSVHGYLLQRMPMLGFQDFSSFTAKPVAGWPTPLVETWTRGLAHCRDVLGPPPWKNSMGAAFACGNRLAAWLWQKYVEHHGARRVYVVSVWDDKTKRTSQVSGAAYEPAGADELTVTETVPVADRAVAIDRVVAALVRQSGTRRPRQRVTELSEAAAPGVDLLAGQTVVTAALQLKASCATLPQTLSVSPDSVLGKSVAARWAASAKGSGTANCSLSLTQHDEENALAGGRLTVLTAVLKCGDATASGEAVTGSPLAKRAPADLLSERLVQGLAARLCK